ncbi:hypothetical protein [Marinimicrobium sp. ABcell2]|uniref:hypothetical protein n=1 Tax=Marinimicrobium sp. ABcell2 TaxID=3069751 RepID=UPI0027B7EEFF|nr:hypothetical protein [Marinimicrobium sp. ABcell2]MDQ2076153.1 hypothetical protein [Marinimicrobium sp. ABcell2]
MASQYPIEDDDVEDVVDHEEGEEEALEDEVDAEVSGKSKIDTPEDFNIAARQMAREELSRQVADFLARGGQIREIPSNFNNDRPKKPVSDFGDRSL